MAVLMKIHHFWDMTQCEWAYRNQGCGAFREVYEIDPFTVVQENCFCWAALKFEVVFCSETLTSLYQSTLSLMYEGVNPQIQNCPSLVVHIVSFLVNCIFSTTQECRYCFFSKCLS